MSSVDQTLALGTSHHQAGRLLEAERAYRQVLEYMVVNLEKGLSGREARQRALAMAALCVGGMAVARAVDDLDLANEIRESAKHLALSLAGWTRRIEAAE